MLFDLSFSGFGGKMGKSRVFSPPQVFPSFPYPSSLITMVTFQPELTSLSVRFLITVKSQTAVMVLKLLLCLF
jgi:hypothetical protein